MAGRGEGDEAQGAGGQGAGGPGGGSLGGGSRGGGGPGGGGPPARLATIANSRGLHARASARFVRLAEDFDAEITVRKGDLEADGKSIMGLMMLAAGPGSEIELSATGEGAEAALDALCGLIDRRFDES